jgi:hypothetical protein
LEISTPVRRLISAESRGSVQFDRSATGAERSSSATASAACAFTAGRPDAVREASPSTLSRMKVERQSRTTSSRTPNAAPMRALVQPSNVSKINRARSASARSRDAANSARASFCSCDATTEDRPDMTLSVTTNQQRLHPLVKFRNPDRPTI